jgi:Xaa-Pro aminopeptidase
MKDLRAVKTALEVEVMQKAIDITENTFRRLLQYVRPGVMEYEIEAEILHSFLSQRATGRLMVQSLPAAIGPGFCIM